MSVSKPLKRKADAEDVLPPTPSSIDSRQKVKVKKSSKKMYEEEMMNLNHSFAEWARETKTALINHYISSAEKQSTDAPPPFKSSDFMLLPNVRKYLNLAKEIKLKYNPPKFQLLTFGSGDCGQLGRSEDVMESRTPKMVTSIRDKVKSVACGGLHTAIAHENTGKVEIWGCNDDGSLGDCGIKSTAWIPMGVRGLIPSAMEVAGQLIEQPNKNWSDLTSLERETLSDPRRVKSLETDWEEPITMVAAGDCQTLMLSTTGRLYMCGCYKDKEGKKWRDQMPPDDPRLVHPIEKHRGIEAPEGSQDWPIHLYQMPGRVEAVSCGAAYNAAIVTMKRNSDDGQASGLQRSCVTWGIGECGELARPVTQPLKKSDGTFHFDKAREEHLLPQPIIWNDPAMTHKHHVHNISCGAFHLMVVAADREGEALHVYGSGLNQYGQLGMGDYKNRDELTRVTAFDNLGISKVAAGIHHTLCLDSSGQHLYGMGRGDSGQLGITKTRPEVGFCKDLPERIHLDERDEVVPITEISCGGNHCMALLSNGDAYTWGYGDLNALGHGEEKDENTPRKLDPLLGINRKRSKDGMMPLKCEVELIDGGGQHSAITICSSIS